MPELIELVAIALFHTDDMPGADWGDRAKEWERDEYREMARAAIKVVRKFDAEQSVQVEVQQS